MKKCPKCGGEYKAVIYGYPTDETMKRAMNGEFKLGGCITEGPSGYCANCQEYTDDEIKSLTLDEQLKLETPIRYYISLIIKKIRLIILIPFLVWPLFIYEVVKSYLKKFLKK